MRHLIALLLTTSLPSAVWAQTSPPLSEFSLPPPARETPAPRAQGPVDDSAPVPAAPRVIAPRPTAAPSAAPRPPIALPEPAPVLPAPAAPVARSAPERLAPERPLPAARTPPAEPTVAPLPQEPASAAQATIPPPAGAVVPAEPAPSAPPSSTPLQDQSVAAPADEPFLPVWAIGLLAVGAALASGLWWRRRAAAARPLTIERPVVGSGPGTDVVTPSASPDAVRIELAAVKLTRSFMNATLSYRITLRSRSPEALNGVIVSGELVAAHGSQPLESQIASTAVALPHLHRVDRLAPGQTQTIEGTLTLPLSNVIPIRQGAASLFVPLLRLVVTADGAAPLARTFVVGQPGQGLAGRLQPFRLDEPPRSYAPVSQRALD